MAQKKVLITGGAGNVGGSLARKLAENNDYFVVIVDNLLTGDKEKLPDEKLTNWKFIKADVNQYRDIAPVFGKYHFDYVFHYAAVVGVKRTLENPLMVFDDIDGIRNVLSLAKNTDVKRVFFSSSSEVYGEPVEFPQHEITTPLNSKLPYAIVKNLAESMVKAFHREYGLNYTIFRFFNTYGKLQSEDFVLPRFIRAALKNEPISIYGDGSQTRTFCYIDDNLETTARILGDELCMNEVINIGHEKEITILELAKLIIHLTGSASVIQHFPALQEGDMTRRCPDNSKMKQILGRELTSLEDGIKKLADYYQSNG
ncbi:MAG: NAD-dependent epimerase/dehydratase family protein [Chitinophagaceae bacterium]|nr:NAD-dependent epimerase/dehydratase family protein [Chitinophagaceae bacterium]